MAIHYVTLRNFSQDDFTGVNEFCRCSNYRACKSRLIAAAQAGKQRIHSDRRGGSDGKSNSIPAVLMLAPEPFGHREHKHWMSANVQVYRAGGSTRAVRPALKAPEHEIAAVVGRQCRRALWAAGRFARAVQVKREYNLNVTARILLNGEFTFCPILGGLRVARERDRQLLRDELPDNVWMSDSGKTIIWISKVSIGRAGLFLICSVKTIRSLLSACDHVSLI